MAGILVGYDGSPSARRALEHARERAMQRGDEIVLLTVLPQAVTETSLGRLMPGAFALPPELDRSFAENARLRLEELCAELRTRGVKAQALVRAGDTADQFLAVAEEARAHEIVIGHKAFESRGLTLGPNAERILRGAHVPVTVVP